MKTWWSTGAFELAGSQLGHKLQGMGVWGGCERRRCEEQVEMVGSVLKGIGD